MKSWKTRLFMGLMLVAMMLATVAGPAMADNDRQDRREERRDDRQEFREEFREDFFVFDHDFDVDFHDCCDDDDFEFDEVGFYPFFTPFFFEVDDVELVCDDDDDDFDGFVECDDLVLVVELDNDFDGFDFDGDGFDFDLD